MDERSATEAVEARKREEEALAAMPPEVAGFVRTFLDDARKPLGPGDPRRHHYLAQFYLRRFASEDDQVATVRLADPSEPTVTGVINTAVIKDFYTVVGNDGEDTAAAEKALALVDGQAAPAIARLAYGVLFPPQVKDRLALSLWLGIQHVRDPGTRRRMEAMAEAMLKMHAATLDREHFREYLRQRDQREPTEDEVAEIMDIVRSTQTWDAVPPQNEMVKLMFQGGQKIAEFLFDREWAIVKFPTPGIVTCDRPLVLFQHPENRTPLEGVGIANADEIYVPLDRQSVLVLHSDEVMGERVMQATPRMSPADFNRLIVHNAAAEIYCHPDDVAAVQALDIPDADRPLIEMSGGAWGKRPFPDGINAPAKRTKPRRFNQARNLERKPKAG